MGTLITVREHALLGTGGGEENTLDRARITDSAFGWLCDESARLGRKGASLVHLEGRSWLRLDNYVGVLQAPCGTRIEILPKTAAAEDDAESARQQLQRMLRRCLNLPLRTSAPTDLRTFNLPVNEWVMRGYLLALKDLMKRGIRFQYRSVGEQQRFLRGRLEVHKQARQPPGRQHLFCIEHDIFDADRPENRLLRSALDRVCIATREPDSWRVAHELASLLAPVPPSMDIAADFLRWRNDRLLAHYQPARPWCSLILNEQSPISLIGDWSGDSLLFPMERVFERYVAACIRLRLPPGFKLRHQVPDKWLCRHQSQDWFQLKPDLLLSVGDKNWVMDTKWKRLDGQQTARGQKYGLRETDFYQMFAYGHRYLDGGPGEMLLIYPKTEQFSVPLEVFDLTGSLHLYVVPFDLESERLVGLSAQDAGLHQIEPLMSR